MTQPKFAPILIEDEVRPAAKLEPPHAWRPHRPAEQRPGPRSPGGAAGAPGPDQGYALGLAERLAPRLVLGEGEHSEDAQAAIVAVGLRRAASFGRAPVLGDLEFALLALGFDAPLDTNRAEGRRSLVTGLAHDYLRQRELADLCPAEALAAPGPPARGLLLDVARQATA